MAPGQHGRKARRRGSSFARAPALDPAADRGPPQGKVDNLNLLQPLCGEGLDHLLPHEVRYGGVDIWPEDAQHGVEPAGAIPLAWARGQGAGKQRRRLGPSGGLVGYCI